MPVDLVQAFDDLMFLPENVVERARQKERGVCGCVCLCSVSFRSYETRLVRNKGLGGLRNC